MADELRKEDIPLTKIFIKLIGGWSSPAGQAYIIDWNMKHDKPLFLSYPELLDL